MNLINDFDMERISQAIEDIGSLCIADIFSPGKLWYAPVKMDWKTAPEFDPFGPMDRWGGYDEYGWFRCIFAIPAEADGKELWVEISQDKREWYAQNPQFLLYCNEKPVQGLDLYHESCLLRKKAVSGETLQLDLDAWAGMVTRGRTWSDKENRPGLFAIRFFTLEEDIQSFYYDIKTVYETAKYTDKESEKGLRLRKILNETIGQLDFREKNRFRQTLPEAKKILEQIWETKKTENIQAFCVGHTHIDIAWMWRFQHTKMKVQRSFSTALKLLDEYPEYKFMSSQPQLYEYMEETQPEQFKKIQKYVQESRWEPEGGMWIEADCNLTSGESLIRQFLIGKKYFLEKFGKDSKVLWLPDVFGYSASLPQICKKCGIDYFMTTKISWNEKDKIPFDTFMWKGVDGTGLLTHFAPAKQYDKTDYNPFGFARSPYITTYNGILEPDYVMGGWKRYSQKALEPSFLIPYGYGDGGGGTTRDMVEKGKRMEKGIPGCPQVKFSDSLSFFQYLDQKVKGKKELPEWNGELYLEFHRGTYTSVGEIKRLNRKAESKLQETEFLLCMAQCVSRGFTWDREQWEKMEKQFLTNQFHDILPGSSITEVYEDVKKIYTEIFAVLENYKQQALRILEEKIPDKKLTVLNTLGFEREGMILFSYKSQARQLILEGESGCRYVAQKCDNGKYIARVKAPAGQFTIFDVKEVSIQEEEASLWKWDGHCLESALLRIVFEKDGTLSSIYDKEEEREVLSGPGNCLETYEDRPYQYDAWEISPYYRKKSYDGGSLTSMELTEMGAVRACITQKRKYLSSEITQNIYVYAGSKRIDFVTKINWKEEHILLKAAFPVDIFADKAVYEIQFATVERPTHTNTSWDAEKFETCAQRFGDISEPGYGAALLNDCKYGYDIHDGVMRLTLLRSPTFPNAADKGYHEFTYSFLPHKGTYREGQVQKHAYELNNPLEVIWGRGEKKETGCGFLIQCQTEGIFIETLKLAEDGNGYIARAYEGFGTRKKAEIVLMPGYKVSECNMLETDDTEIATDKNRFITVFKPFEIKTFRITCKNIKC